MKATILTLLLVLALYNTFLLLIFFKNRKGRLLLMHSIPPVMAGAPLVLSLSGINISSGASISAYGFLLHPLTFIYLITDYYPLTKKRYLITWSIFAAVSAGTLLVLPGKINTIISIYITACSPYLLIILRNRLLKKLNVSLLLLIYPLIFTGSFFFYGDIYSTAAALMLIYLLTNIFLLFDYSRRTESVNNRISGLNTLNKRLDQAITRQKQKNEQLKKIIAQKDVELLQIARHASLAEVTTGIAHELAQPLTGIKCISQSIIDDINYEELDLMQAVSDLSKISSLVDRSSSIIDHIRTFSRKRGFSFQPADLNACILNAVELVNNQMRNSGIDVEFVLDETIPGIYGDNLSLEQLFINLILNSRDAINTRRESDKTHTGRIRIRTGSNERNAWLIIEDNGCGIPEDIVPKIWTPFFTTKRKGKGTGIGLSLSHRIIKEHNAEVSVESSDEGTRFSIIFPVEHPSAVQEDE